MSARKILIRKEEAVNTTTIPFTYSSPEGVEHHGKILETIRNIGRMQVNPEHSIEWTGNAPDDVQDAEEFVLSELLGEYRKESGQ